MGPEEVNAEERLRIQLWDSDRTSADDDLGRIEVDLKELMHSPQSNGKMWDRTDGFFALEGAYSRNNIPFGCDDCQSRWAVNLKAIFTPRHWVEFQYTCHRRYADSKTTQGVRNCQEP